MAKKPAAKKSAQNADKKPAKREKKPAKGEKKPAKGEKKPAKKPSKKKRAGASPEDLFLNYVESEVQAMLEDAGVKLSKEETEEVVLVVTESLEMPVAMLVGSLMDTLVGSDDADFDDDDGDEIDDEDADEG